MSRESETKAVTELSANDPLRKFVLDLAKALLQAGYYSADHPHAKKFLHVLHESFQQVLGQRQELTFVRKTIGEQHEILVDGFDPQADVSLSEILPADVAQLFLPKFVDFFLRKRLLSFSIKSHVSLKDFIQFITLMTDSYVPQEVVRLLQQQGITSISIVVEEDLLYVRGKLPWRVELALARLRRDMSVIPYFRSKDRETIRKLKHELVEDIMRPIRDPDFVRDILLHIDLVYKAGDLSYEENLEEYIVTVTEESIAYEAIASLIEFCNRKGDAKLVSEMTLRQRTEELISLIFPSLQQKLQTTGHSLLRDLYSANLIDYEKLPKSLQRDVLLDKMVDEFVAEPEQFLQRLARCDDENEYKRLMKQSVAMSQIMVAKRYFAALRQLVATIHLHDVSESTTLPQRQPLAAKTLEYLFKKTPILENAFAEGDKEKPEDVEAILLLCQLAGSGAIEQLLGMLSDVRSEKQREQICELLGGVDRQGQIRLISILLKDDVTEITARYLLRALARTGAVDGKAAVLKQLHSRHSSVRSEAVEVLFQLGGGQTDSEIAQLFAADFEDVTLKAIEVISRSKTLSLKAVYLVVRKLFASQNANMQAALIHLLSHAGNPDVGKGQRLEDVLIEWWQLKSSGWIPLGQHPLPSTTNQAICFLLGKIGTQKSVPILQQMAKSKDEQLRKHATAAAKFLQKRLQ